VTQPATRNIYVERDFMPSHLAVQLREAVERFDNGENYHAIYPPEFQLGARAAEVGLFDQTAYNITKRIAQCFGEDVTLETKILVAMRPGSQHTPHADAEYETAPGVWAPNHTPNRAFSALLYLTREGADHKGGKLHVGEDVVVKAEPGKLVMFPSTRDYVHWVTPIESGTRINMSVWVTRT
jgi:hypothetical protein